MARRSPLEPGSGRERNEPDSSQADALAAGEPAPGRPRLHRSSVLKFTVRLVFGLGLLFAFAYLVDFRAALEAILDIPPLVAAAAFLVAVAGSIVVPAVITRQTLSIAGLRLGLGELVLINFGMRFYVLMLPHAFSVGLRWQRYRTEPGKGWQAATLILFERLVQLLMLLFAAAVFLAAAWPTVPSGLRFLLPLSAVASVVVGAVVLAFVSPRAYGVVEPALKWVMARSPEVISRRLLRLNSAITAYQTLPRGRVAAVISWAALAHLLFVSSAWLVAFGLDLQIGLATIGWMRSVVFLLTVLPITVGGLGVREFGFAALLGLQGVDPVGAASFPLVLLGIQLGIGGIGAVVEAVRAVRRVLHV